MGYLFFEVTPNPNSCIFVFATKIPPAFRIFSITGASSVGEKFCKPGVPAVFLKPKKMKTKKRCATNLILLKYYPEHMGQRPSLELQGDKVSVQLRHGCKTLDKKKNFEDSNFPNFSLIFLIFITNFLHWNDHRRFFQIFCTKIFEKLFTVTMDSKST